MQELDLNTMAQISGGVQRLVNTGTTDNAAIRSAPTQGRKNQIASLPNGSLVDTLNESFLSRDPVSGRNYVEIRFTDKNGRVRTGWIAASIVGLPR